MSLFKDLHSAVMRWGEYQPGTDHLAHAALHISKAAGKVASAVEARHHKPMRMSIDEQDATLRRAVADLIICSARVGALWPMDLEEIVRERLAEIDEVDRRPLVSGDACC